MTKVRSEVLEGDTWDVHALYSNWETWEHDYAQLSGGDAAPAWESITALQGKLHEGPETLKACFEQLFSVGRLLDKLYTYAHLRHDEDISNDDHKAAFGRVTSTYHAFAQATAFIDPEILGLNATQLQDYLDSPVLKDYHFHLQKLVHRKQHTLPAEQEALLALAGKALQTPGKAFSALNDADFDFGEAVDGEGVKHPITHGSYALFIRSQDRALRKSAFETMHKRYASHENTLCELLNGCVQSHILNARARGFDSCLGAALHHNNIDTQVYRSLIDTVNSRLDVLHRYQGLRKRLMGVDSLHLYDVYVPLSPKIDLTLSYDEAVEACITSVGVLGKDYQDRLRSGLNEQRWVDRYENKNKRSGAYSSGCYDSHPYILMNYKGVMRDAFTLAHEAGHSMHSEHSHRHQAYHYSHYSIFVAEVASTFNEELLGKLLLERHHSQEERFFLINERVEDLRATLFRQTMFAEFELTIHEMAERNEPLTPNSLRSLYRDLNAKYFGPDTVIDDSIAWEWARIPHFYYNFYVYQYATGVSAALALVKRVLEGGDAERDAYLGFLKGGCSQYPVDLLRQAGVDMCTPEPVQNALDHFEFLVNELERLSTEGTLVGQT
jgi:oligoendopeptidase F